MKKISSIFVSLLFVLSLIFILFGCSSKKVLENEETTLESHIVKNEKKEARPHIDNLTSTVTDYSSIDNWMFRNDNPEKEIDLFYIYPTICSYGEGAAPIDDNMKIAAQNVYASQAMILSNFTNVYVPYYRQAYFSSIAKCKTNDEFMELLCTTEGKADIYAALDYYFENCNNGRPYILAGHSQGSALLKIVLEEYMVEHKEYYKNMVVTYALGFAFTKDDYEKYPHMKPAKGERDTGVVVSWNTEGPNATKPSFLILPNSVLINPLNWKTDETAATIKENFGSIVPNSCIGAPNIEGGVADATIDLKRGALICTTNTDYLPDDMMGDKSLHTSDWGFYIENIRRNAIKRSAAFLGHYPYSGKALTYSDPEHWLYQDKNLKYDVDTIYIYPTVVNGKPGQIYAAIDDELKMAAATAYGMQASALEGFTNMFVPYYRQVPMEAANTCKTNEDYKELIRCNVTITDVFAALDYYFENLNGGRPFILASHSQGTAISSIVLCEYFKKHQDYIKRMVCTYTLGFGMTEKEFEENPHLKFATGELDTNVVIDWNTEAAGEKSDSLLLSKKSKNLNINPLTWTTDDTYADISLNKGSLEKDPLIGTYQIVSGAGDAQIDLERGSIICTTLDDHILPVPGFGGKSLHGQDWGAYYINIQENAKKRIKAYFEK